MSGTVRLGEVVEIKGGGTPSRATDEYWGGSIPWATVKDFSSNRLERTAESITSEGVAHSAANVIPAGSVIAPTRMAVGKVAINTIDVAINQDLKALLPRGDVDNRFLLYFLLSKARLLESRAQGATVKGIRVSVLRDLEFPDLPVTEQRRIADILDKADDVRRKCEQAIVLADRLPRSVFLEMFGDPALNRKGWRTAPLSELGEIQGGLQVSQRRSSHPMQRPYLRVANVFRDRLDLGEIKVIGLTPVEHRRVRLLRGDVLIVEGHGNPGEIGRTAVWDGSLEDCVHQDHLIRLRPDSTRVLGEYVSRLLNSYGGRRQLVAAGRTTSGLNTISTAKVKEVIVPVPPIDLQKAFVAMVREHDSLLRRLEAERTEAEGLCASTGQRAFRGEL